ncbi:hypothetical protein CUR178_03810 [Leishmania enriettii]|uniref:protein disulfide-isomerase n=1 Tax=Leishmania enriettii TaxID=5663 RepID=A0A836G7E8_LEIEN|nr:hypothetical protein CUR178_03810 [Leishmania enriettii]
MCRRLSAVLVLVLVVFVAVASCSGEDPSADVPGVMQLNKDNFDEVVGKGRAVMVEFYAPWCGHCKRLAPEYAALGAAYENSESAKELLVIGKVDAVDEKALGKRFGIEGFPTILFFPPGSKKPEVYKGGRSADDFAVYLSSKVNNLVLTIPKVPQFVKELVHSTFEEIVKDPSKVMLVFFHTTWCGNCKTLKPIYNELAKAFAGDKDVLIASLNVGEEAHRKYADKYVTSGLPALYFFPKDIDAKPVEYTGGHNLQDLLSFVNANAGTHRLANGDLSPDYGIIDELAEVAARVAESSGESAKEEVKVLKEAAAKLAKSEAAAYYIKAAESMAVKGVVHVENELARLQRLLGGSMAGARRDNVVMRVNILSSIQKYMRR